MAINNDKPRYQENSTQSMISNLMTEQQDAILNALIVKLRKALKALTSDAKSEYSSLYSSLEDLEDQLAEHKIDIFKDTSKEQQKAIKITREFEKKLIEGSSVEQRAAIHDYQINRIKAFQAEYKNQKKFALQLAGEKSRLEEELKQAQTEGEKELLQKKLENIEKLGEKNRGYLDTHAKAYESSGKDLIDNILSKAAEAKGSEDPELWTQTIKQLKDVANSEEATAEEKKRATKDAANFETKLRGQKFKDREQEIKAKNADRIAELKYRLTTFDGIKETISNATAAMVNGLSKMFDNLEAPINDFYQYQAKYEARLQGSENGYAQMMKEVSKQLGLSPFIKQRDMVKKLQDLVDKGVNYNVELRAYIATASEGIASTFDAFDSNLLRLIRIQQNDSTAARLGMEATLTQMLNRMYSDTSYLSGVSDQVSQALIDASAQLTHQGAAEMEFAAQKWLGSLYSLGVGDTVIQNIATGLGYLGSGNIEALSGNDTLMSLLAMSASRGGTSISEILTGGLTASRTDKLLQGMVEYLAEIANNTDSNNVTKSAMAQVFGLTNTDLRSISNLTQNDIDDIALTDLSYGGALTETNTQLSNMWKRVHMSQWVSNLVDNATVNSALMIGSNPVTYGLYKTLSIVSGLVGDRGLEIPGIQAMGTGTASGIDILSIAKAGVAGTALMAGLISSLGSLGTGGVPALSAWSGYEESLKRGSSLDLKAKGVQSGFSESTTYSSKGSASTDDLGAASMQTANESAKENMSEEDQKTADLAETFYEDGLTELITIREHLQKLTAENDALKVVIASPSASATNEIKLGDIADDAVQKLSAVLKPLILSSLIGDEIDMTANASPTSLIELLASAMDGMKVHIDNDWFDEAMQKNALGGT